MVKVFLDTNVLIDVFVRRGGVVWEDLEGVGVCISPLSFHIYCYVYKIDVLSPKSMKILKALSRLEIINLNEAIVNKALNGPTDDFENNVQLHSGAVGECDLFVTNDKRLLKMKYFGKMRIASRVDV
jgi:predicted nucleic acid-binding protein